MLTLIVVIVVSFGASWLTFFSGFGLGTLLLPVFALFFPATIAVAATAVVHLLNNLFKLGLVFRHINRRVLLKFGIPAIFSALLGASLLLSLGDLPQLFSWSWDHYQFNVTATGLCIGLIMVFFAIRELTRKEKAKPIAEKWLPFGGVISGFFGGLSGHQGAMRSAFLIGSGLGKQAFIATGVAIACLVDFSRIGIYLFSDGSGMTEVPLKLTVAAVLSAFAGAFLGRRYLEKVTLRRLHQWVGWMLLIAGIAIAVGII